MALTNALRRLWRDQRAQDMIEYGLLGAAGAVALALLYEPLNAPIEKVLKAIATLLNGMRIG